MALNDKAIAYLRTIIPYGIGAALAWLLATTGLNLTGDFQVALVVFSVTLVTNMYYFVVRLLEVKFSWVGVFLGVPKSPDFSNVDNLWASFVRTAIPTVVGGLLTLLFVWVGGYFGFHLDADTQSGLIVSVVAVVSTGYYALARAIVAKWPAAKILLGTDVAPTYPIITAPVEVTPQAAVAATTVTVTPATFGASTADTPASVTINTTPAVAAPTTESSDVPVVGVVDPVAALADESNNKD